MPETTKRITQLVDELHQLLEGTERLDDEAKLALRIAANEIDHALGTEDEEESAFDNLRERLERFEGEHPTLTEAVRRFVDQLADLGI